jgi:hypothetical protein
LLLLSCLKADQCPIRTVLGTETTAITFFGEGDLKLGWLVDQSFNFHARSRKIKHTLKPEGATQHTDEASGALSSIWHYNMFHRFFNDWLN